MGMTKSVLKQQPAAAKRSRACRCLRGPGPGGQRHITGGQPGLGHGCERFPRSFYNPREIRSKVTGYNGGEEGGLEI